MESNSPDLKQIDPSAAMIRLTALWALSEAGLGGVLHLFRSPFTGLIVGSVAVMLISLMAYVSSKPGVAIARALTLVLIVKMTISPHSPLPAYLAVAFQGLMGILLFSVLPGHKLPCLLLGILALMESALQKLLTLTLIFGNSLWESIDIFIEHTIQKFNPASQNAFEDGSLWLIGIYISVYALGGLLIGIFAGRLPGIIEGRLSRNNELEIYSAEVSESRVRRKSGKSRKRLLMLGGVAVLIICIYIFIPDARSALNPIWIFLRVIIVLAVWYFLIAPFLLKMFRRFLRKKESEYREDVEKAMALLPQFRLMSQAVWRKHSDMNFIKRLYNVILDIISYALRDVSVQKPSDGE